MQIDKLKQFLTLTAKKKAAKKDLEEIDAQLEKLDGELTKMFEQDGVNSMNVDGKTVYVHNQKWAGVLKEGKDATDEERARALQALRDAGMDDYITESFNSKTLSSFVKEVLESAPLEIQTDPKRWYEVLPPSFAGAIKVTEETSIRVRGVK
jgi:hypothetical protein